MSFDEEFNLIRREIVELISRHVDRLRRNGWSIEEINDLLEIIVDWLGYMYGEIIEANMKT